MRFDYASGASRRLTWITDEKNDKLKELIRKKFTEYLDRAEKLKEHLAKADEKRTRAKVGVSGAGGSTAGGGDGKKEDEDGDPEIKKLRAGLQGQSTGPAAMPTFQAQSYQRRPMYSGLMSLAWLRPRKLSRKLSFCQSSSPSCLLANAHPGGVSCCMDLLVPERVSSQRPLRQKLRAPSSVSAPVTWSASGWVNPSGELTYSL